MSSLKLGLRLRIRRYQALPPGAPTSSASVDQYFDLGTTDPFRREMHEKFSSFSEHVTRRTVNWSRTFLRRSLHCEDYVLKASSDRGPSQSYVWQRREDANPKLPLTTTFTRNPLIDAPLQGEVLTALRSYPLLTARHRFTVDWDFTVRSRAVSTIPARSEMYVLPLARLQELWDLCAGDTQQDPHSQFLKEFSEESDFGTICHLDSPGALLPTLAID